MASEVTLNQADLEAYRHFAGSLSSVQTIRHAGMDVACNTDAVLHCVDQGRP